MPVNLINIYSTRNIGDAAILSALAVMSPDGQASGRIPDARPWPVTGLINSDVCDQAMPFVSVGGDIFNNARPYFVTRRFMTNLAALVSDAPRTMLFGQSIPRSCKALSFRLLSRAMRRLSSVTVRDAESWRRLRSMGVNADLSYDTAFALPCASDGFERGAAILAGYGLDPERTALLSLRGFDSMYPGDEGDFIKRLAATADLLSRRGHQCAVVIQAEAGEGDSDVKLAALLNSHSSITIINPASDSAAGPVANLMAILAAANIVIAVRYHTAVLRLLSGRMPVVLSYSNKTRDLIDRLGLPGWDIDTFDPAEVAAAAERTAGRNYDPSVQARCVRDHFKAGLQKAGYRP